MSDIFRIVLRDVNRHDPIETREFELPLDSTKYPIGRASKNNTKRELAPAATNAYIDSPVISREHAVLFADTSCGSPQVYISDCKSMHGTKVNDHMLEPNTPKLVSTGDILQFGVDVNRNEEFFVARKYRLMARLTPSFSRGFTVPDAESEEEEFAWGRRGSQANPLTLDDSDAASNHSGVDSPEITLIQELVVPKDEPNVGGVADLMRNEQPVARTTLVQDSYASEDEDVLVYSSDNDADGAREPDIDSNASNAGSGEMERDYPSSELSEPEVPDSEDDDGRSSSPRYAPRGLTPVYAPRSLSPLYAPGDDRPSLNMGKPAVVQSHDAEPSIAQPDLKSHKPLNEDLPELPPFTAFKQEYNGSSFDVIAPPLPPRPFAPLSAPWNNANLDLFEEEFQSPIQRQPSYSSLFVHVTPGADARFNPGYYTDDTLAQQQADQLQTPPPMPASEVATSPLPEPGRRTKVSIEEIVEEQPLTPPTSVKDLKRKADVFEKQDSLAQEEPAVVPEQLFTAADEPTAETAVAVTQTAAMIAQRPKKQPRSLLSKLGKTATYPLLGAAGAVAAFTFLATAPDTFFAA